MSDVIARMLAGLPKGDGNGLQSIASAAAKDQRRIHVTLALLDCRKVEKDADTDTDIAKMRVRRIEVITDPDDAAALQRILMRAFERRTGATVLPFELEEDVEAAFADLDPDGAAEQRAEREAAEPDTEHAGADDDFADELAAMKDDLDVTPTRCVACGAELRFDPKAGHVDADGHREGDDGHQHEPADS